METTMHNAIQLTPSQAKNWINKYYPNHFNFQTPLVERNLENLEYNKISTHVDQSEILFQILTAPTGSAFLVRKEKSNSFGSLESKIGKTIIQPVGYSKYLVGYKDETCDHIELAFVFLKAKSFGWFKLKKPLY